MNDSITVFPDTNTLLHYPPLKDVDRLKVCGCTTVRLVLCMQVVHELDEKKDDPRLGDRAKKSIKEIDTVMSAGGGVRDGVTIEIFNYEISKDDFLTSMSFDSEDDRIVHSVKKHLEDNEGCLVVVYTEDMGMRLRCQANSVAFLKPDQGHRLQSPQDETVKKYRQVLDELNELKNRMPVLALLIVPCEGPPQRVKYEVTLKTTWKPLDEVEEESRIRKEYPHRGFSHLELIQDQDPDDGIITTEERERYNSELDTFYLSYKAYVKRLNRFNDMKDRAITFDLWLENSGTCPAGDIDISLSLPPLELLMKADSEKLKCPPQPSPPILQSVRRGRGPSLVEEMALTIADGLKQKTHTESFHCAEVKLRDNDTLEIHKTGENGYRIHAKVHRMKHGEPRPKHHFHAVSQVRQHSR